MKTYKTDLHIHTCLSPCAKLEMTPKNIVKEAEKYGLDIIGICDHNSCENVSYVRKLAEDKNLNVTGGMEITSKEEVHILALFESEEELLSMQETVYEHLHGTNDEDLYGDQVVVDENDEVVEFNRRLLIGATDLPVETIVDMIHELNGIVIASHIDRESFGLISQLGFVPEGLQIDAFEVSVRDKVETYKDKYSPVVMFSDAHTLNSIGKKFTSFSMEQANLKEIGKALIGEEGRRVFV